MKNRSGNISIMLILIIILLSTLTTTAVAIAVSTLRDTTSYTLGERALTTAESGVENAILLLLRDPSYAGETNLPIGPGTATIEVTGTNPKVVTSVGTVGSFVRTIQASITLESGQLNVTSWQEL